MTLESVLGEVPIRYFHARLDGAAHIPTTGAALLVGNHTTFGVDSFALAALIQRDVGRRVRFLAERHLFRLRWMAAVLEAVGAVPGEPDLALELLRAGELVCVYPGGIDGSWKLTATERHRLQWGKRAGFARVAMRAQVPIVPIAGIGIDDAYDVLAREPWIGRRLFGHARYDLPLVRGRWGTLLPRRAPMRFVALAPIDTTGLDAQRPADVEAVRRATHEALSTALGNA